MTYADPQYAELVDGITDAIIGFIKTDPNVQSAALAAGLVSLEYSPNQYKHQTIRTIVDESAGVAIASAVANTLSAMATTPTHELVNPNTAAIGEGS